MFHDTRHYGTRMVFAGHATESSIQIIVIHGHGVHAMMVTGVEDCLESEGCGKQAGRWAVAGAGASQQNAKGTHRRCYFSAPVRGRGGTSTARARTGQRAQQNVGKEGASPENGDMVAAIAVVVEGYATYVA